MAHAFGFTARVEYSPTARSEGGRQAYAYHLSSDRALKFGNTLEPRLSAARDLLMSELLRFL